MSSHINIDDKRLLLKEVLSRDLKAADLRLSLFVAAARSFKYDSCLQPFPPDYLINGEKNIDELKQILDELPKLDTLNLIELKDKTVSLLHWILCKHSGPRLRTVPKSEYDSVFANAPCLTAFQRPQWIFHVQYQDDSHSERMFRENLDCFQTHHAYHGSKVFNFYSILNYGLQQHLNKTALFGEGIYLSAELNVSQMFAPTGAGWSRSVLGSHLACTALCEYIDNPAYVKCQEENQSTSNIPERYILVKNNDLIQVRYLLVYGSKRIVGPVGTAIGLNSGGLRGSTLEQRAKQVAPNRCLRWMAANQSWLLAGGYFLMLLGIGMMNSRNAHYMKQMFWQKINHMCNALFGGVAEGDT
ncbi:protein mono-ADP-ribosyltransferase PARP16-like [Topomyia yanbarensis]|uniref:protein mono-ADP-ribosyltransferase PARP16-like n=1 Tax=Topomyia yanbarensis TaxID=2498891 RepID=UPI00273CBAEF|nr:protein mono-ADP-ribosyltransferase PARP16-like [Topomyia yanbarensis]